MATNLYEYKGNQYNIIEEDAKLKLPKSFLEFVLQMLSSSRELAVMRKLEDPESGKSGWFPAVIYRDVKTRKVYAREKEDFFKKFKKWKDESALELPID